MIEITLDSVRSGLEALVAEKGEDFVYNKHSEGDAYGPSCRYVWNGEPDCIVGQLLARMGVPVDRLAKADGALGVGTLGVGASILLCDLEEEGLVHVDDWKICIGLNRVQSRQDGGYTWGEAIQYF